MAIKSAKTEKAAKEVKADDDTKEAGVAKADTAHGKSDKSAHGKANAPGQEMTHQRTLTEIGNEQRVNPAEADELARKTALPPQSSRPGVEAGEPVPGAGEDVDPTKAHIRAIGNEIDVKALPIGTQFLAAFIHKPKSDDDRLVADRKAELVSGRQVRRGVSPNYWANHSTHRPPLAERTDADPKGYVLLD